MPEHLSNHIKALLIIDDVFEAAVPAHRSSCITLQQFDYSCGRTRDELGMPYNDTGSIVLQFTIKAADSDGNGRVFYERLRSVDSYSYSFVFNATFDSDKRLSGYEDAMTAEGYVVEVEEIYSSSFATGSEEQMLMKVKLIVREITYAGKNNNKKLATN